MTPAHRTTGSLLGWFAGALAGRLVCYVEAPFGHYTILGNEVIVEVARRAVSPGFARVLDSPFHLFSAYTIAGLIAGFIVGAAGKSIAAWRRWEPSAAAVAFWQALVIFTGLLGAYGLVGMLHFRLPAATALWGGALIVLIAAAIAALVAAGFAQFFSRVSLAQRAALPIGIAALSFVLLALSFGRAATARSGDLETAPSQGGAGSKVLLLCVDGLGWDLARPMMEQGELPGLTRIIESGTSGALRSALLPIKSPQVWTSVATSRFPADHKVFDFLSYSEEAGKWISTTNRIRQKKTFWDILGELNVPVDVLSWYPSWPPDPIPGVMLTDRATYFQIPERVHPPEWEGYLDTLLTEYRPRVPEFRRRFTDYDPETDTGGDEGGSGSVLRRGAAEVLDQTYIRDLVTVDFAKRRIQGGQPDVMAVYFRGVDAMQHKYRKFHGAMHDPKLAAFLYDILPWERDAFGNVIAEYLRFVDESIAEILDLIDPYTTVMLVSDHGSGYRYDRQINLKPNPLLLHLGMADEHEDGGIDKSESRILGLRDSQDTKLIRLFVNLRSRKQGGWVEEVDFPAIQSAAMDALSNLQTTSGNALFEWVKEAPDAGKPAAKGDILARFNEAALGGEILVEGKSLPVSAFAERSPKSGNHRVAGVIALCGKNIPTEGRIRGASIYDIVPTLFYLLDLPVARDWEGDVILPAIDPEYRNKVPVRWVESYGDGIGPRKALPVDAVADEAIKEELRSLGYIK